MSEPKQIQMNLQWAGDLVSPPSPVNQFLLIADPPINPQAVPDLHVLMFGFVTPPAIPEDVTNEALARLAEQALPVIPVGRFAFSTARLRQLHDTIAEHLQKVEGRD